MAINASSRLLATRKSAGPRQVALEHETPIDTGMTSRVGPRSKGTPIYLALNFIFAVCVLLLSFLGDASDHDPALYLILLMALLSSPLLYARSFSGPYMVLGVSVPFFFMMFGLGDLVSYFSPVASIYMGRSDALLTYGEIGVLVGFLFLILGYAGAVGTLKSVSRKWFVNDWAVSTALIVGLMFFVAGMVATFVAQIKLSMFQIEMQKLDAFTMNSLVIGRMVGELGEILLAYVLVRTKSKLTAILILALIIFKIPLGVILNAKYIGISFIMSYLVVAWIYKKSIPWKIILAGGLAMTLMFPLAYKYRAYMGTYYVSVGETLEDVAGNLDKALSKKVTENQKKGLVDSVLEGLESMAERADLKPAVELIIARTGADLPYQSGYTLSPLLYVLLPRFILPDKPDVPVGQLFNQQFKISTSPDTWISTSFLGELYWNFSWVGVIVGMFVVGYVFGAVGSITNLNEATNVTRLLIILITIATLVFKFQTGIAQQYSVFIRSFIIIVFLHLLFSRRRSGQGV